MAPKRVADMTVEELRTLIAEVVAQQLHTHAQPHVALPKRTKAEQLARNRAVIELLDQWREEGDEEEQRETFEYLKEALDEDRLSNRPLFPEQ
jgi:RNA binding exosome subunit